MKKFLLTITCAFAFLFGQTQLPANTVCPDFTGTDLDGNEWNLYSLLDEGKTVIIEVSAAWCNPCWNYHQTHILKNFHEQYGPEGTDEAMVLFIEGESTNTSAQLLAAANTNQYATHSMGNWVEGTPFPIIDNASIANLLGINAFPTFFMICPDRIIKYADGYYIQGGQARPNLADWAEMMNESDCSAATAQVDPRFLSVTGVSATCSTPSAGLNILLQNKGTEPLTAATITVTGATSTINHDWTGNLATYATTTVNIPGIMTDGLVTVNVMVTSEDDDETNSQEEIALNSQIAEATTHIRVEYRNDPWPEENSWKIKNSSGTTVASSPAFSANPTASTLQVFDYWVPATGCYTFEFSDEYSDGLNGSYWGTGANYYNGSLKVMTVEEDGTTTVLYLNDGSQVMNEATLSTASATDLTPFDANSVVSVESLDSAVKIGLEAYPNPTSGVLNLNYTLNNTSDIIIDIVDAIGMRVKSERIGTQVAGTHNTTLDLSSLAAGIYMVNFQMDGATSSVRVMVK
jgi:hypothetical protein